MSEQTTENPDAVVLPDYGDAAFAALMDTLAPETADPKSAEGGTSAVPAAGPGAVPARPDAPAAGAGGGSVPPAGTDPAPAAGTTGTVPTAGDGTGAGDVRRADGPGQPAAAGADGALPADGSGRADARPEAGDRPAAWTTPAAELIPKFTELTTALETKTAQAYQQAAFEAVQTEHQQYFDALNQHPRTMVGREVPALDRDGMEVLRDAADAKEWQEAVKQILVEEIRDRATRAMEENSGFLDTVHASIELFTTNTDLIPGTKEFDVDLANRFADLATPYELRVEGKLQGYSIPVQPIIDQLRTQLVAERARATAHPPVVAEGGAPGAPVAGTTDSPPVVPATPPADPPQAGIQSKAGNSSEQEDFSVLFGTIGLPHLQI